MVRCRSMTIRSEPWDPEILITGDACPARLAGVSLAVRNHSPTGPRSDWSASGPARFALGDPADRG